MLLAPDTDERSDLTAELDDVAGRRRDRPAGRRWTPANCADLAGRLEPLENRVSLDRRALHVRIDTLQAELVERHKTGRCLGGRPALRDDPVCCRFDADPMRGSDLATRDSPTAESPGPSPGVKSGRTEGNPFVKELPERFIELGSFIREQRVRPGSRCGGCRSWPGSPTRT